PHTASSAPRCRWARRRVVVLPRLPASPHRDPGLRCRPVLRLRTALDPMGNLLCSPCRLEGDRAARALGEGRMTFAPDGSPDHAATASTPASPATTWPAPLGKIARIGVLGEFLSIVENQTEADPAAIALTLLVYVGNAVGRAPCFFADG